ncbi:MAG: pyridoxamine 5'-phosphate oxidase family protein [Sporocytophaga sp.]|uniref:pyridoxamine 5'-phosphate oxidase family protein n=1 Tax=Sporocytophaga sp. TaxID=2231183 RepID=UPI001B000F41|nr:pyridoxamine 5'-phosphate oxidase family protein [Sporocytophaga sp.]MBO9701103.1 pyridoxamine 5'-phosphate oxidase family protein [Sporocytophaga sp.]
MVTCKKYTELHDMIKDIKIAMLTTVESNGCLRSVPMTTMQTECEGLVWFFTNFDSQKVEDIRINNCINVTYSDVHKNVFVSVTGKAEVVKDPLKMQELWKPVLTAYFPNGLEDPDLGLLKVSIDEAEYWDSRTGKMIQVWEMSKDAVR